MITITETIIIFILFVASIYIAHNQAYDKGYIDGKVDGAREMWETSYKMEKNDNRN